MIEENARMYRHIWLAQAIVSFALFGLWWYLFASFWIAYLLVAGGLCWHLCANTLHIPFFKTFSDKLLMGTIIAVFCLIWPVMMITNAYYCVKI